MSFRDDHDAALARITALEHELAHAGAQARRDSARIAMLERELAELRRGAPAPDRSAPQVPRAPPSRGAAPPDAGAPRHAPADLGDGRGPRISHALLALLLALATAAAVIAIRIARADPADRAPTTCTVDSVQRGVHVIGIAGGRETDLGITPVRLTFDEWADHPRVELRLDGHDPLAIPTPADAARCDLHPWRLFPR